jgi:hypothetical protein
MEQFLANLRIILPVIGLDMLKPQPKAVTQTARPIDDRTTGEVQFEIRHRSGVRATAVEEDGEFVILEGSEALPGTPSHNSYATLRQKLIDQSVLVERPQGGWTFSRPWSFSSPSAAASVVLDRNANGRTEWKVNGASQTYHDWQQAQAAKQEAAE